MKTLLISAVALLVQGPAQPIEAAASPSLADTMAGFAVPEPVASHLLAYGSCLAADWGRNPFNTLVIESDQILAIWRHGRQQAIRACRAIRRSELSSISDTASGTLARRAFAAADRHFRNGEVDLSSLSRCNTC